MTTEPETFGGRLQPRQAFTLCYLVELQSLFARLADVEIVVAVRYAGFVLVKVYMP